MNEKLRKLMNLGMTEEEAKEVIKSDELIDKMTSTKEIDSDLTEEQRKNTKKARQADRKPTVYNFDKTKKPKKENPLKAQIIESLTNAVTELGAEGIEVLNEEREFSFSVEGTKFKVVLSCPRK